MRKICLQSTAESAQRKVKTGIKASLIELEVQSVVGIHIVGLHINAGPEIGAANLISCIYNSKIPIMQFLMVHWLCDWIILHHCMPHIMYIPCIGH